MFEQDGAHDPNDGILIGKDADHVDSTLISLLRRSIGLVEYSSTRCAQTSGRSE
jgi:hypothetical protein